MAALPFRDGGFDAVLAVHMLYHVPYRQATVRELRRVLAPGGVCVAVTNGGRELGSLRSLTERAVRRATPGWRMRRAALVLAAAGMAAACGPPATASGHNAKAPRAVHGFTARAAPAGWHHAVLPGRQAVLAYPPAMQLVTGDRGTVTAARISQSGSYLLYLNATPRQGAESLRNWPRFRMNHLLGEDASAARLLAASRGLRFTGATGSSVLDTYTTKIKAHHYTELACFVQGRSSASVIVAAAPAADWPRAKAVLTRAVGAYQAR